MSEQLFQTSTIEAAPQPATPYSLIGLSLLRCLHNGKSRLEGRLGCGGMPC